MSIGTVRGESSSPISSPASRRAFRTSAEYIRNRRWQGGPATTVVLLARTTRCGTAAGCLCPAVTFHVGRDHARDHVSPAPRPSRHGPRPPGRNRDSRPVLQIAPDRVERQLAAASAPQTDRSSAATTAASARDCGRACGLSNAGTASDEGAARRRVRAMPRSARSDRQPLQLTNPRFRASDRGH